MCTMHHDSGLPTVTWKGIETVTRPTKEERDLKRKWIGYFASLLLIGCRNRHCYGMRW